MNTLMLAIMVVGVICLMVMRRELFPVFDIEYITISVPYPGASPEEVEEGICQKIEEAIRSLDGIKKISSTAREGLGMVVAELYSGEPDVQKILNEIRSEVDRIPSFPLLAEDPEIKQLSLREPAIKLGVIGPTSDDPEAEIQLRTVAERVREELLRLPEVTQVEMRGVKDYQIDIEIPEDRLREYGLTLQQVADIVRRENIELPGGSMRTESQEILLRGKNKSLIGYEIAQIPLVTKPGGVVLTVGDLGTVRDEFADTPLFTRVDDKPAIVIAVQKTTTEDLLKICEAVDRFVANINKPGGFHLPEGYQIRTWDDISVYVRDRLDLLARNGLQGLILVLVMLGIFLERRLAFWVAMGLPLAFLGTFAVMLGTGQTLNMMSMFAFLTALGILVDDAIVVGENVYTHRQAGKGLIESTVDGMYEVLPSVVASVMTTIIAFCPLLFVEGIIGKFIKPLPMAVITMLLFSLFEVIFILPCHLAHGHDRKEGEKGPLGRIYRKLQGTRFVLIWTLVTIVPWAIFMYVTISRKMPVTEAVPISFGLLLIVLMPALLSMLKSLWHGIGWFNSRVLDKVNEFSNRGLQQFIHRFYRPTLAFSLHHPMIIFTASISMLFLAVGLYQAGVVKYNYFGKMDSNRIYAAISFPDGTPAAVTIRATEELERSIREIGKKYGTPEKPVIKLVQRTIGQAHGDEVVDSPLGSHYGSVTIELVDPMERNVDSMTIVNEWRKASGKYPGVESLSFESESGGPPGKPIEFSLLATPEHMADLEKAAEECKTELAKYPGVFDIFDDSRPGKWEYQIRVKDEAKAMGNTVADLAETVRASYYGEEVMRLQRGRHEVKLMVRYPLEERRSLANFDDIRVRTAPSMIQMLAGDTQTPERPLSELADIQVERGFSEINRIDQLRSITVTSDLDEKITNAREIVEKMKKDFFPQLLAKYPDLQLRWEGQQEQTGESIAGLIVGLVIAILAMFGLLTFEFRSYLQPLMILSIIPFGAIGALIGHLVMGIDLTILSLFGLVALTGVVVNDSIVLIDFMNHRVRSGLPLIESLVDAGCRRFRPVMLTSLTTVAGLSPILMERSLQAQFVIPMAVSLCFGLMFATLLVLVLVPTVYLVYARITRIETEAPSESADFLRSED